MVLCIHNFCKLSQRSKYCHLSKCWHNYFHTTNSSCKDNSQDLSFCTLGYFILFCLFVYWINVYIEIKCFALFTMILNIHNFCKLSQMSKYCHLSDSADVIISILQTRVAKIFHKISSFCTLGYFILFCLFADWINVYKEIKCFALFPMILNIHNFCKLSQRSKYCHLSDSADVIISILQTRVAKIIHKI